GCLLFSLIILRYPPVACRGFHLSLRSTQSNCRQRERGQTPESRKPAEVSWRANDRTRSQGEPRDCSACSSQPCLRVALRNLKMARPTISPSVSPLVSE